MMDGSKTARRVAYSHSGFVVCLGCRLAWRNPFCSCICKEGDDRYEEWVVLTMDEFRAALLAYASRGNVLKATFDGMLGRRGDGSVALMVVVSEEDLVHYTGPILEVDEYEREEVKLTVELTVHRARRKT